MAFKHGRKAEMWLDAVDVSGLFESAEVGMSIETAEASIFKAASKSVFSGQMSGALNGKGFYDPTVTTIQITLGAAADSVATFGPAGMAAIGDLARLVAVAASDYKLGSPVGGLVSFDWGVKADGDIGWGYTLHSLSADVNTTTGADRDDGAATTNGWIAHLHVTAVSGGSWVVKIQDAATTDWTDVTNGAFTAATIATAQRLVVGGTLRRHVRYVATRTGGVGGDSITFGLGIART